MSSSPLDELKERKLYAVEKPDTDPLLKSLIGELVDTVTQGRDYRCTRYKADPYRRGPSGGCW